MDRLKSLCRSIRHIAFVLCLLAIPLSIAGREYRTQTLRTAAMKLGIEQQIGGAVSGTTSIINNETGQNITIRINDEGIVEHIGLQLFNSMMRQQNPLPIYDCIEYAALDYCLIHSENDLLLQKIRLFKGSWQTVCDIQPTDNCSILLRNEKAYQVIWERNGAEIVKMAVPVDYELLMISNRRELEQIFTNEVEKQRVKYTPYHLVEELLQPTEKDGVYVLPGESFMLKGLTQNTYYKKDVVSQQVDAITYEEERMSILVDSNYPAETMANLLMSNDPSLPNATMRLDFQLSSYAKKSVSVTLRQWISYCEDQGCIPYFIFDDSDGTTAKGYLLMRNQSMAYNHLLSLSCSMNDLINDTPMFTGKAYLFIPNVEASRLFGSEDNLKTNKKRFR